MILLDYNGIAYANICANKMGPNIKIIRHMILNTIRSYNKKFKAEYGSMVIATDRTSWRRDIFPHYKFSRSVKRAQEKEKTAEIFEALSTVREEIKENLPQFTFISAKGAEADDIIGTATREAVSRGEKVMIVSSDKDFLQLQSLSHTLVHQYSAIRKKIITCGDPLQYLTEHIIRGDAGDGIPNILSPEDIFTIPPESRPRQTPITKKFIAECSIPCHAIEKRIAKRMEMNRKLIDLSYTPQEIQRDIIAQMYYTPSDGKVAKRKPMAFLNYLIRNKCAELAKVADDFDNIPLTLRNISPTLPEDGIFAFQQKESISK